MNRFLEAQEKQYADALAEIKAGQKETHWMWFVFPQIAGLGSSTISRFYALKNAEEAKAYLSHKVPGNRLKELCEILLTHESNNPTEIFGTPDALKLHSSMTLFAVADEENVDNVFEKVLDKFFSGKYDYKTMQLI